MDYKSYRAHPAISKSDLDLIRSGGVANFIYSRSVNHAEKSKSLSVGDAYHTKLLEPEKFGSKFSCGLNLPRRKDVDKKAHADHEKACSEKRLTMLSIEDMSNLDKMIEDTSKHPYFGLFKAENFEVEKSLFFNVNGVDCKSRLDYINHDLKLLIDVKTSGDISRLWQSFRDYRYHVQSEFYTEAAEQNGMEGYRFLFFVISTNSPKGYHDIRLMDIPDDKKEEGRRFFMEDIDTYKEYDENELVIDQINWRSYE